MGARFDLEGKEQVLYRPEGERFVPYVELRQLGIDPVQLE